MDRRIFQSTPLYHKRNGCGIHRLIMILHEKHSPDKLDSYDVERLKQESFDEVWYSYLSGSYEGSGQMIYRKGDLWGHHDMGHCSCYGPIDQLNPDLRPLNELLEMLSVNAHYWSDISIFKDYNIPIGNKYDEMFERLK